MPRTSLKVVSDSITVISQDTDITEENQPELTNAILKDFSLLTAYMNKVVPLFTQGEITDIRERIVGATRKNLGRGISVDIVKAKNALELYFMALEGIKNKIDPNRVPSGRQPNSVIADRAISDKIAQDIATFTTTYSTLPEVALRALAEQFIGEEHITLTDKNELAHAVATAQFGGN